MEGGKNSTQVERRAYAEEVARAKVRRADAKNGDIVKVFYYDSDVDAVVGPVIGLLRLNRVEEGGVRKIARLKVGDSDRDIRIRNLNSIVVVEKGEPTLSMIARLIYK